MEIKLAPFLKAIVNLVLLATNAMPLISKLLQLISYARLMKSASWELLSQRIVVLVSIQKSQMMH